MENPNISSVTLGKPVQTIKVTTPNGVKVDAVVVNNISEDFLLCYSQNRLFTMKIVKSYNMTPRGFFEHIEYQYDKLLCNYCIIPGFDIE